MLYVVITVIRIGNNIRTLCHYEILSVSYLGRGPPDPRLRSPKVFLSGLRSHDLNH